MGLFQFQLLLSVAEEEEEIMEEMLLTTSTFLPQEIVMEILSRLPANSLVSTFKFVCKTWRTLIQDPGFIKMHLLNRRGGGASINGRGGGGRRRIFNSNSSLLCKSGNKLYQLHPPFNDDDGVPSPIVVKELDFDLASSSTSRLVGSCNGLLCIRDFRDDQRKNYIIILNPSTRKYKVLPEEPEVESYGTCNLSTDPVTYGFGCCYNNNNNDYEYKLVRITYFFIRVFKDREEYTVCKLEFQFQIHIYSMSSNSWKMSRTGGIKDYPALISRYRPAIFLNGALHWTGSSNHHQCPDQDVLICFDLTDEDYRPIAMPLPPPASSCVTVVDKLGDKILINVRGCLGIIFVSKCWDFDIWVMKEYGIRESWTRECVIRSSKSTDPLKALSAFSITWKLTVCFLKGDQILIDVGDYGRMALYNMNSKKFDEDFKLVGVPYKAPTAGRVNNYKYFNLGLADYIETLVSLKSSSQAAS